MTLIELLIVIVIFTTIVAAAIPLMSPSNNDRQLREAARGLNTFISGAQARAISTNRPFGVAIKRLSQDTKRPEDNSISLEVFYIEQQPPYAGFDANSRACVALHPTLAGKCLVRLVTRALGVVTFGMPPGWTGDYLPPGLLRPGDVIEINGTRYELLDPGPSFDQYTTIRVDNKTGYFLGTPVAAASVYPPTFLVQPINDSGQQINPRHDNNGKELGSQQAPGYRPPSPYWTLPAPYKVLRQPTPASDEPYQLPEGTAIDLRASGVGSDDFFYVQGMNDNSDGILVMFTPEGRVQRVTYSQLPSNSSTESTMFDKPVVDNIFLLVGRRENVPPAPTSDPTLQSASISAATTDEQKAKLREPINWLSGTSRWIVIGSQSGRIATIDNAFADLGGIMTTYSSLGQGNEALRNQQIYAAREFTREMGQLGGR